MEELLLEEVRHSFVSAERLSKHLVLDSVSLRVGKGEFVLIRGANGAGKSTLLRIAAGLLRPEAGSATYAGRRLTDWRSRSGSVGFLPQSNALYLELTVQENFALARALGAPPRHRVDFSGVDLSGVDPFGALVERLQLAPLLNKRVRDCSQGMQRRVAFARMLLQQPALLLLDEPCAHIDEEGKAAVVELLLEAQGRGVGGIIVEHQLDALARLNPRHYELRDGVLQELT